MDYQYEKATGEIILISFRKMCSLLRDKFHWNPQPMEVKRRVWTLIREKIIETAIQGKPGTFYHLANGYRFLPWNEANNPNPLQRTLTHMCNTTIEGENDMVFFTEQYKHMLWHDEQGKPFLLLKYAEVFEYHTVLGLHCWSKKMLAVLRFEGLILFEMATDDPLYILRVDRAHLARLISLGAFKKRPDINGAWLKEKEKLLGP